MTWDDVYTALIIGVGWGMPCVALICLGYWVAGRL